MKTEYELWNRVKEDMEESVERLTNELKVNQFILNSVKKELKNHPKPKQYTSTTASNAIL